MYVKVEAKRSAKIKLFQATVESILLYGSETWTVATKVRKMFDGCYTRLLISALAISWKAHLNNEQLYGDFPKCVITSEKDAFNLLGSV